MRVYNFSFDLNNTVFTTQVNFGTFDCQVNPKFVGILVFLIIRTFIKTSKLWLLAYFQMSLSVFVHKCLITVNAIKSKIFENTFQIPVHLRIRSIKNFPAKRTFVVFLQMSINTLCAENLLTASTSSRGPSDI